jgi:hypothetical protein
VYATPADDEDLWFPAPAALNHPRELFHTPVYDRGAMTLQAQDFIALAERESRQQLDDFFQVWLFEEGKPTSW